MVTSLSSPSIFEGNRKTIPSLNNWIHFANLFRHFASIAKALFPRRVAWQTSSSLEVRTCELWSAEFRPVTWQISRQPSEVCHPSIHKPLMPDHLPTEPTGKCASPHNPPSNDSSCSHDVL
ncbi:hypothetical protein AVEN_180310-1 [Araneus ventricosus]|uniref:Uncharacterized protein n=1 Tax=Araneus ventricosus TaxID=182803 RepID=A0A4Y2P4P2_ARAVE|nr:hypothetical protein AVEN_180310-1 [Araneus ventricosus]